MSESTHPRGVRRARAAWKRWLAVALFVWTSGLMVIGAAIGPKALLHAEDMGATTAGAATNAGAETTAGGVTTGATAGVTTGATTGSTTGTVDKQPEATTAGKNDKADAADKKPAATTTGKADTAAADDKKPALRKPKVGQGEPSSMLDRMISILGIAVILLIAFAMSNNRKAINWRLVGMGLGLQLVFALFIFYVPGGKTLFAFATDTVEKLLQFTNSGSSFVFNSFVTGKWEPQIINFAFAVLPTIIFFSSLMTILYHLGLMQRVVKVFAWVMQKTLNTSGAESLSAAANIFVGQTEAPLVIKPYVNKMTNSELMTVMTGGFATVAGGVMAIYVGMLKAQFPDIAGHLLAASVMSAPAALVLGKMIIPETEVPETSGELSLSDEKLDANVLDAASRGAAEGLLLALNVAAMLIAFLALVAMVNYLIGLPGLLFNKSTLAGLLAPYLDAEMKHNTAELARVAGAYKQAGLTVPKMCMAASGLDHAQLIDCLQLMGSDPQVAAALGDPVAIQQATAPGGCGVPALADDKVIPCIETLSKAAGTDPGTIAPALTMQKIFGYLLWPFAWVMGVPAKDCYYVASLLGEKVVVNEVVAYGSLAKMLADPGVQLSDRSVIIATYSLCGFANLGSIGIQLGGIGGIAPDRKGDLAKLAFRAMIAGTLAACMTGTVAGILI